MLGSPADLDGRAQEPAICMQCLEMAQLIYNSKFNELNCYCDLDNCRSSNYLPKIYRGAASCNLGQYSAIVSTQRLSSYLRPPTRDGESGVDNAILA